MPSSYTLGKHFEAFIQSQLAGGRYGNASEVIRDALRLLENRVLRSSAVSGTNAHHVWFSAMVQEALDDTGPLVPNEDVKAHFAKRRDEALKTAEKAT